MNWTAGLFDVDLDPYTIYIDLVPPDSDDVRPFPVSILPPHELFHCIAAAGPMQKQLSLVGQAGPEGLKAYWEFSLSQEWGQAHPALVDRSDSALSSLVPLLFHIDGGEIYRNSEFHVVSFRSHTCPYDCNVFDLKFPCCILPHAWMPTKEIQQGAQ